MVVRSSLLISLVTVCWTCPFVATAVPENGRQPAAIVGDGTRSIELPHFEPDLPITQGRDEFMMVCASCHSPRYVTMQPPFPAKQWTETVDKMAKNYGAQMDAAQRQAIIGYLVAINGPDSKASVSAADDDDDGTAKPQLPRYVETDPNLPYSQDPVEEREKVKRGADLFGQVCASCHGPRGHGDGFVGQVLFRKPENLAASRYSKKFLSRTLWNGKRGTAMPSWRGLSAEDLAAVAEYVDTLHLPVSSGHPTLEVLRHGKLLFLHNCAPCHGEAAEGNGVNAATLLPPPANFKLKQPDLDYILEVLQNGIAGTAMPSWREQLSGSDRQAIASYVRSLFDDTTEHR